MRTSTVFLSLLALCVGVFLGGEAVADRGSDPLTPGSLSLPSVDSTGGASLDPRAALRAEVEAARAQDPVAFEAVEEVRSAVPTLDARRRGPYASITRNLKALGERALHPMLGLLLDPTFRQDSEWSERQKLTLVVGLVEAVGMLREPSALVALTPLLSETRPEVLRAAIEAIGRIGTDEAADIVAQALTEQDPVRLNILISGAGDCRRLVVAQTLAGLAERTQSLELALTTARALRDIGNAQAWKTAAVAASGEADEVQRTAAQALVTLWHRFDDPLLRERAETALRVVSPSSVPPL